MAKIGIYGGSFNPIHFGHIGLVTWIAQHSDLDEIWMLISPNNPLKDNAILIDEQIRLANVNKALKEVIPLKKNLPHSSSSATIKASDFEFNLPRPNYTANTLRELKKAFPKHDFSLIIGADNWAIFEKWKEYDYILNHFRLIVYPRPNYKLKKRPDLPAGNIIFCQHAPLYDISSTQIRNDQSNLH